jgi:hypothetical protein
MNKCDSQTDFHKVDGLFESERNQLQFELTDISRKEIEERAI